MIHIGYGLTLGKRISVPESMLIRRVHMMFPNSKAFILIYFVQTLTVCFEINVK